MLVSIVPARFIQHLCTLHRDPCRVRLLSVGLDNRAHVIVVDMHDHLNTSGEIVSMDLNAKKRRYSTTCSTSKNRHTKYANIRRSGRGSRCPLLPSPLRHPAHIVMILAQFASPCQFQIFREESNNVYQLHAGLLQCLVVVLNSRPQVLGSGHKRH